LPERIKNFAEEISKFDSNAELTFQISIDDMPENHNRVRKVKNLFDSCIETYRLLKKWVTILTLLLVLQ
jgi:sulfatase maturation enzyme AslB (radical SAM superfamily)